MLSHKGVYKQRIGLLEWWTGISCKIHQVPCKINYILSIHNNDNDILHLGNQIYTITKIFEL